MWCLDLRHSDLWLENNFWWEKSGRIYEAISLRLCTTPERCNSENTLVSQPHTCTSLQRGQLLGPGWRGPGRIALHLTSVPVPWSWPLLSAGRFSSPGFLHAFNTYACIPRNRGFSYASSGVYWRYTTVCNLQQLFPPPFYFGLVDFIKFIHVGTCSCGSFIFPLEPFEVLNSIWNYSVLCI